MAETRHKYVIRLEAEGGKVVSAELQRMGADGTRSFETLEASTKRVDSSMSMLGRTILTRLVPAFSAYQLGRSIVGNIKELEKIDVRLRRLTEGSEDYAAVQEYLSRTAQGLNIDIGVLSDGYAKLLALQNSGVIDRGEVNALVEGLVNAGAALGASGTQIDQVLFGLSQGLTSGVLKAEELNQVVEPLPGLLQELDKAAGLAAGGFRRMVVDGKVTSEFFASTMITALKSYEGAAADMSDTVTGSVTRLNNAWKELSKTMGESFIVDAITGYTDAATLGVTALDRLLNRMQEFNRLRTESDQPGGFSQVSFPPTTTGTQGGIIDFQTYLQHQMDATTAQAGKGGSFELNAGGGISPRAVPVPGAKPQEIYDRAFKEQEKSIKLANDEEEKIRRVIDALKFRNEQIMRNAEQQEVYNQVKAAGVDLSSEQGQAIEREVHDYFALTKALESAKEETERLENAADAIGTAFSSAFEKAAIEGEGLNDVLNGLLKDIERVLFRETVGSFVEETVSGFAKDVLPSLFGGFKAEGGPLDQGKWYVAGEHGPEPIWGGGPGAFAMGYSSGGSQGGDTKVNVTVVNQTSREVQPSVKQANNGRDIEVVLVEKMGKAIRSGALDGPMRSRYGANPTPVGR